MSKTVVLVWDCYGLEAAFSITDLDQQRMWAMLKGEDPDKIPMPMSLTMWEIRAQANMHRNYEIYIIQTTDDISVDDIVKSFENAPQQMADRVREIGHKVYGHRVHRDERILIR